MAGSGTKVEIKIEKGESTKDISTKLADKSLINSSETFYLYMKIKEKTIKTGDYLIPNNLSIVQIASILESGEHQVKKITIPEGWRREQIAAYLEEYIGLSSAEFMAMTKDKEGRLFPDTYDLMDEPTIDEVVTKMTEDFKKRTTNLEVMEDALILASIVEREAANDSERADIAGVFANRLDKGIKLEADPTVQYQKDTNNYQQLGIKVFKFWQKLVPGDLKTVKGEYNTYLYNNLPPAPICNPGLKSIEAAVSPTSHNYMFFLHGKDGKIYFSVTEAEHNKKKALYL
jgi:UPF0755 protein